MITISASIMHASFDEGRRKSVSELTYQLYSQGAYEKWTEISIIKDANRHGPWWTAKQCWQKGATSNATHHILMQDDILLCKHFVEGIEAVIEGFPNDIISLFAMPRKNFDGSCRWGEAEGTWGPSIVMPSALVKEFLVWEAENINPSLKHDDSRISLFAKLNNRTVKVPFPNLVDHRDNEVKTVQGNRWSRPRMSVDFMGSRNPNDFDWTDTQKTMKSINSYTQFNKYLLK